MKEYTLADFEKYYQDTKKEIDSMSKVNDKALTDFCSTVLSKLEEVRNTLVTAKPGSVFEFDGNRYVI